MLVIVQFFVTFLFVHAPSSFFFPLSGPHFSFENGKSRKCVFACFLKREIEKDREKKRKVIGIFGNPTCRLFAFGKRYPSSPVLIRVLLERFFLLFIFSRQRYTKKPRRKRAGPIRIQFHAARNFGKCLSLLASVLSLLRSRRFPRIPRARCLRRFLVSSVLIGSLPGLRRVVASTETTH